MNGRSRREISKLLTASDLRFHHLKYCDVHVFLSQSHPLAVEKRPNPSQLKPYPAFYFEQDEALKPILIDDFLSDGEEPLIHISVRVKVTAGALTRDLRSAMS